MYNNIYTYFNRGTMEGAMKLGYFFTLEEAKSFASIVNMLVKSRSESLNVKYKGVLCLDTSPKSLALTSYVSMYTGLPVLMGYDSPCVAVAFDFSDVQATRDVEDIVNSPECYVCAMICRKSDYSKLSYSEASVPLNDEYFSLLV